MPYMKLECEDCGSEFEGWHNSKYCSDSCGKIKKTCTQCEENYYVSPCDADSSTYCSRKCRGLAERRKEELTCPQCNVKYEVPKCEVEQSTYCSRKCMARAYQDRVTLTCECCGEPYETCRSDAEGRKYCSEHCQSKSYEQKVQLTCNYCGGSYKLCPSKAKNSSYCSRNCQYKGRHKSTELVCSECGSEFQGYRNSSYCNNCKTLTKYCNHCGKQYTVRRSKSEISKYCTRKCQQKHLVGEDNPNWKGGYEPYYGENWPRMRRLVRDRDAYTCRRCGTAESDLDTELHVHHIVPIREFDEPEEANTPTNLVSVCPSCHGEVEGDVEAGRALL